MVCFVFASLSPLAIRAARDVPRNVFTSGAAMLRIRRGARAYAAHTARERRSTERLYIGRGYAAHTPREGATCPRCNAGAYRRSR